MLYSIEEDEILPNRTAVCIALRTLVEECTVILGHCYSPKQVHETKRKQKILMNEAIKKILPGLNLEEDCTSYAVTNSRFLPDDIKIKDPEVEYHPLQFGLSSEHRRPTTQSTEMTTLKSSTTFSSSKVNTSPNYPSTSVATSKSTVGSSASKIPTAFLQSSTSILNESDLPTTTSISIIKSPTTTSISISSSTVLTIQPLIDNVSNSTTQSIEKAPVSQRTIVNVTTIDIMPTTENVKNSSLFEDESQLALNKLTTSNSSSPSPNMNTEPESRYKFNDTILETTTSNLEIGTTLKSTLPSTTDVTTSEDIVTNASNNINQEESTFELAPEQPKPTKSVSNSSDYKLPDTATLPTESITFMPNKNSLPSKIEKEMDDSINDAGMQASATPIKDNEVTLTKNINVNREDRTLIANTAPDHEIYPEGHLPSPIIAKTTMNVNKTVSTVTEESIFIIPSEKTVIISARPNIAQPISSQKEISGKENSCTNLNSQFSNLFFTFLIFHISSHLIS